MTTQEFSNMFDTLLNSYNNLAMFGEAASRADIVLDEYEKSVLLTLALDIIIKSFFERTGNATGQGFDDSMRRQVDFSNLITVAELAKVNSSTAKTYDDRGILYSLPTDLLIVLNEKLTVTEAGKKKSYIVVPINYKEYDRQMSKAYNLPLKKQCWRLFQKEANSELGITTELIPIEGTPNTNTVYKVRYIRRPKPIVLVNLNFDNQEVLEIDGVKTVSECELNPIIHMEILNKAVELALTTRGRMQQPHDQRRQRQED